MIVEFSLIIRFLITVYNSSNGKGGIKIVMNVEMLKHVKPLAEFNEQNTKFKREKF